MRRQPDYLQGYVRCACLVPESGLPGTIVCGMNDGTLTRLIYQSDTKAFLKGRSHEPGDPVLDVLHTSTKTRETIHHYIAALGTQSVRLFSSDLELMMEKHLVERDSTSFFVRGQAPRTSPESDARLHFCRSARLLSLSVPDLEIETLAEFEHPVSDACMEYRPGGEAAIVGLTDCGDLWLATPEKGLVSIASLGLIAPIGRADGGNREWPGQPARLSVAAGSDRELRAAVLHRSTGEMDGLDEESGPDERDLSDEKSSPDEGADPGKQNRPDNEDGSDSGAAPDWRNGPGNRAGADKGSDLGVEDSPEEVDQAGAWAISYVAISDGEAKILWRDEALQGVAYSVLTADSAVYVGGGTVWTGIGTGGWVRCYDTDGGLLEELAVFAPVRLMTNVNGLICALHCCLDSDSEMQGNLIVLTPSLRRIWSESCEIRPRRILSGDIGGDESADLVVIGNAPEVVVGDPLRGRWWSSTTTGSFHGQVDCYINEIKQLGRKASLELDRAGVFAADEEYEKAKESLSLARYIYWSLGDEEGVALAKARVEEINDAIDDRRRNLVTAVLLAVSIAPLTLWQRHRIRRWALWLVWRIGFTGRSRPPGTPPPCVELVNAVLEFQHSGSIRKGLDRLRFNLANLSKRTPQGRSAMDRAAELARKMPRLFVPQVKKVGFLLLAARPEGRGAGEQPLGLALCDAAYSWRDAALAFSRAYEAGGDCRAPAQKLDSASEIFHEKVSQVAGTVADAYYCPVQETIATLFETEREALTSQGVSAEIHDTRPSEYGSVIRPYDLIFVLENLMKNACRAMSDSKDKVLNVVIGEAGEKTVIEISDTGRGMQASTARKIERGVHASRESGGFGLARSKDVLEEYGGEIKLTETKPGKGTTFTVTLMTWPRGAPRPKRSRQTGSLGPGRAAKQTTETRRRA